MPATATHSFFVEDVYNTLPEYIKENINIDRMKMFGQSVDSLKFYNILSIKKGKDIRNFSKYFHDNKTKEFFHTLINYIKINNYKSNDIYSFLYGFICHYILDSTMHPFVIYKTGEFNKNDKTTYKYNNLHTFMETFIDNYMIKKYKNINPYTYRIDKTTFCLKPFSYELNDLIDYTFKEVFDQSNMSKIYFKSLKQMSTFLKLFRYDKYGIKKNLYKLIDTFTPKRCFRFEAISYHVSLIDKDNFLNNNNELWRYPTNYSIKKHDSFDDLYKEAIKICKKLICASYDYINGNSYTFDKIFTNNSYITGLDCCDKKELKYFKF